MTKKKQVVVVEDEESLQRVLVEWLIMEGYGAMGLTNGQEALDYIPKTVPDLVLLDIILPLVNGFEVLQQLKANPVTQAIPVIIMTNLGDERDHRRAMELGADRYLVKSDADLTVLKKIIEEVLK